MSWRLLTHEFAEQEFGFNVVGFISGSMGLGVAARNTVRSMHDRGIRMRVVDYDLGDDRSHHDMSCARMGERTERQDPFAVNVFHVNPPEARGAMRWGTIDVVDRFNACVPFWELTELPPDWVHVLGGMDVVLTPTEFIRGVVQRALPDAVCLPYPQAAILPNDIAPNRARWGLPDGAVVFVSSFDMASDVNRKNPWAVMDAFSRAFPDSGRELLVVKANTPRWARAAFPQEMEKLKEVAARDDRIVLIDEVMPFADVLSLYASSDVLVSLHRSEGLGLSLMEAMTAGKPVVATAWSGNMDFCTESNSCLVGYELIPVVSRHNAYDVGYVGGEPLWADPDVEDAARHMRRLAEDPAHRRTLGAQAAKDMEARRAAYLSCGVWDQMRDLVLDEQSVLWRDHLHRIDRLTAV
jgi:glycosyltransferase involved in cell wall biosynthesis